jgi:serine/threonine protein kinase
MCRCQFNVFVDSHGRGFVRCSGYSRMLGEIAVSEAQETHPGDFRWAAPELVKDRNNSSNRLPTSKSDVWSFGCIMIHVHHLIPMMLTLSSNHCLRYFPDRFLGRIFHLPQALQPVWFKIVYHNFHERSPRRTRLSSNNASLSLQ